MGNVVSLRGSNTITMWILNTNSEPGDVLRSRYHGDLTGKTKLANPLTSLLSYSFPHGNCREPQNKGCSSLHDHRGRHMNCLFFFRLRPVTGQTGPRRRRRMERRKQDVAASRPPHCSNITLTSQISTGAAPPPIGSLNQLLGWF